jgi:restriction system protein
VENFPSHHSIADRPDVRTLDWLQFERLVALLFKHEGFQVERPGAARQEDSIDFLATKQGVTFGVKCKHWKASRVGVDDVRAFVGALHGRNLRHGFIATLEGFTEEALDQGRRENIDLMDETMLLENLETVNWRFNSAFLALWGNDPKTCPKCESTTVLRVALKPEYGGHKIWGCATFPACTFKMALN